VQDSSSSSSSSDGEGGGSRGGEDGERMDDDEAAQFKAFMEKQRALEEAKVVPKEEFVGPTLPPTAHATTCAPDALAAPLDWSCEDSATLSDHASIPFV
jgi:hypothetical protein